MRFVFKRVKLWFIPRLVTPPKKSRKEHWYRKAGLKHVTGFVNAARKAKLKKLAAAADKSLARYVSRLLERHADETQLPEEQEPAKPPRQTNSIPFDVVDTKEHTS